MNESKIRGGEAKNGKGNMKGRLERKTVSRRHKQGR